MRLFEKREFFLPQVVPLTFDYPHFTNDTNKLNRLPKLWIKGRGGYSRLLSIKVNPIFSPTGVDFTRGQSMEVIQRALINHNDDGRLRAVSLFS